jgi:hypothetical protein
LPKIPEILAHPWLAANYAMCDTPDSGVVIFAPPLPPSPSELARPIASPEVIDQDLLASLKVIWGKHTDSTGDNIIRDLCSPPGYGVHAKAFYFLLGRYREETMQQRLIDGAGDYQDVSQPTQEGEQQKLLRVYRPRAMTSPVQQRTPPILARMSQPIPSIVTYEEPSSGATQPLPSPVGPRPPPAYSSRAQGEAWRNQFQQYFPSGAAHTPTSPVRPSSVGCGGPRPHPTKKTVINNGHEVAGSTDVPILGFAQNLQSLQEKTKSKTPNPTTNAPAKGKAVSGRQLFVLYSTSGYRFIQILDAHASLITAPQAAHPMLQQIEYATQQATSVPTHHHDRGNFSPSIAHQPISQVSQPNENYRDRASRSKTRRSVDKENMSASDEGWSYIGSDPDQNSFGLTGLDAGRVGKDVGNLSRNVTSPPRGRKDKKNRRELNGVVGRIQS